MSGWQPIETAPRDGTSILGFIRMGGASGIGWHEYHVIYVDIETGEIADGCDSGWQLEDYSHWHALPDAPVPTPLPHGAPHAVESRRAVSSLSSAAAEFCNTGEPGRLV